MSKSVVVIGSGAAGTAATIAAHAAGATVTMVRGRTGASSLTSGALDGDLGDIGEGTRAIVAALELHALVPCTLATSAGTIRSAAGRDASLANLDDAKGPVLVARVAHHAWDGDALAAAYAELDPRGFVARDIGLVLHTEERSMSHGELASRHDEPARLARAAERIRDALGQGGTFSAVLLPPWLGARAPRARELSALASIPCGEVLAPIDGPAGLRFNAARDRWLQNASITTHADRATRVATSKDGLTVELARGERLACDAVVLATGGVLAGGIAYTPGDATPARAVPPPASAPFQLSYEAPVVLGRDGRPLLVPGSVFGVAPESLMWPGGDGLERVGILAKGLVAGAHVFACGDALEGRARTVLAAFATGAAAGRAAAT